MADAPAEVRVATREEGVLALRVEDLVAQIREVNAVLRDAKAAGGVHTVRLVLLYNDRGWKTLPDLFRRIFRLLPTVTTLQIRDAVDILWRIAAEMVPRGDHVARALGQVERPDRLQNLTLINSQLSGDGLERLEAFAAGLPVLDISGNYMTDAGLRVLSTWTGGTASLQELRFGGNRPTARGIHALVSNGHLSALTRLHLSDCTLGDASVRRLVDGELPALTELVLGKNPVGDGGAVALAESAWSERLSHLDLSSCGIESAGARALANSLHLRSIGWLDLRGNEIGDRGRKVLHDRFGDRVLVG